MSTDLARHIIAAFAEIDLSRRLQEQGLTSAHIKAMVREREEVEQQIPFWDRLVCFSDTKDEARSAKLMLEIRKARGALAHQTRKINADLDKLGGRFAAVELWRRIDACLKLAQTDLRLGGVLSKKTRRPGKLLGALNRLAWRVLELYVPDFDAERLLDGLADEASCRAIARPVSSVVRPHPTLGYEPISLEALMGLVAGRMLETRFFSQDHRRQRLKEEEGRLNQEWVDVKSQVGVLDGLNVFSRSEAEKRVDDLYERTRLARESWIAAEEERRLELASFLTAYPPLHLHLQVGAVLGALAAIGPAKQHRINKVGSVKEVTVIEPRALVDASLHRLRKAFLKVYPGLPMPSMVEFSGTSGATTGGHFEAPRTQILKDFTRSMDRREGVEGVEKCLVHASMKHSWSQTLLKVGDRVSWADKLAMWSNSPDEEMVFRARARRRWHERALAGEWDALLSTAQEAAMEQAPLRIRELAISAARNLKAVGTTSPCAVNEYRGKTLESLGVLRQSIGAAYGMHGSRSDLMGAVAARLGEGENPEAPPLEEGAMRGLSYADVVEMAAAALAQTNYRDQYLVLTREMGAYDQAKSRVTAVKKDISFWDMVNVFTDTKEERERDDLKREMREKSLAIKSRSVKVNELFDAALAHYPPAVLYCRLGAVEVAVSSIYAKLVTRTYTDSKGRTRTSTSCNLYNKNRAVDQLAGWNAEMVAVFGRLPDVHECLQRWVSF